MAAKEQRSFYAWKGAEDGKTQEPDEDLPHGNSGGGLHSSRDFQDPGTLPHGPEAGAYAPPRDALRREADDTASGFFHSGLFREPAGLLTCSAMDKLTRMAVSSAVRRMKDFAEFRYGAGVIPDRCPVQDAPREGQCVPAGWKYMDPVEAAVHALRDYRNMERLFQTGRDIC